MEEPFGLQSMGSLRVGYDWATSLSLFTFITHSSVLAWRIPGMGEPGGLLSMRSHRVGHDWSNLAAAAVLLLLHTTPIASINKIYHSGSQSIIFSIILSISETKDRVFHVPFILLWSICFRQFIFMLHVLFFPIFLFDTEAVDINPAKAMYCFHFLKCIYLLQMFGFYFIWSLKKKNPLENCSYSVWFKKKKSNTFIHEVYTLLFKRIDKKQYLPCCFFSTLYCVFSGFMQTPYILQNALEIVLIFFLKWWKQQ